MAAQAHLDIAGCRLKERDAEGARSAIRDAARVAVHDAAHLRWDSFAEAGVLDAAGQLHELLKEDREAVKCYLAAQHWRERSESSVRHDDKALQARLEQAVQALDGQAVEQLRAETNMDNTNALLRQCRDMPALAESRTTIVPAADSVSEPPPAEASTQTPAQPADR